MRSTDTWCELALRRQLWRRGWRYRLHARRAGGEALAGCPDLVFVALRVVVFVDGDFWHGRALRRGGVAALAAQFRPAKRGWWVPKITATVARDRARARALRAAGWRVVRLWESDVLRDPDAAARRVERYLRGADDGGSRVSGRRGRRVARR